MAGESLTCSMGGSWTSLESMNYSFGGSIMLKKIKFVNLLFLLMIASMTWGQQTEKHMSLDDCIVGALKNNLGLAVEVLNPQLADISVAQAKEIFFPSLIFGYNRQKTETPAFSWLDASGQVEERYNDYSAQLTQLIPIGGRFSVDLFTYKNNTNRKFQEINPLYWSRLRFSFTQPLLKNFGFKVTRREIIVAQNNTEISENMLKGTLLNTIYNVEEAYWNLVYSIENLDVMKSALELARDLLAKNKREVEIGMLAPIEVLSAQSEVASREADILQAESLIKSNEDRLKTILNLAAEIDIDMTKIIPTDTPTYEEREISLEEALAIGLQKRPDLKASRIDLKNKDLDVSYAKNQLLPEFNLEAAYWSPGISGTQILYQDGDPLTEIIVGTIPGQASDALKDAMSFKYRNWGVGLTLSIPINSVFSRAQYAQAKVTREQAELSLKNQEQQAFLEIRDAVRNVQTNYKRIQAYKVARELAKEKLDAEEKKLKVGLTTNYLVLQHQRDLANARSAELRAIIDYNLSLATLDRDLGMTLEKRNIKMTQIWSAAE
jgi:outer membrane protein TolC